MGNLIGLVQQIVHDRTALGREMREMMERNGRGRKTIAVSHQLSAIRLDGWRAT